MKTTFSRKGFTLIELLIVIAIVAILAAVVFVALDPLTRFRDARDSSRWADISAVVSAIRVNQVDNGGAYVYSVAGLTQGTNYMISDATTTSGCNASACSSVTGASNCVNLHKLVERGYLGKIPVSPNGSGRWDSSLTGYYMSLNTNNSVTVAACEAENTSSITVTR